MNSAPDSSPAGDRQPAGATTEHLDRSVDRAAARVAALAFIVVIAVILLAAILSSHA